MYNIQIRRVQPNNWHEIESDSTVDIDILFERTARILENCTRNYRGCWIYNSTSNRAQKLFNGKQELVYRTIFMVFNDCIWPDPTGRHLCGDSRCVNYEHMWPGDTLDQTLDNEFHTEHSDWTAPRDWYSEGSREAPSVGNVFASFLTGTGWGDDYSRYLDKYNIFELIHELNGV